MKTETTGFAPKFLLDETTSGEPALWRVCEDKDICLAKFTDEIKDEEIELILELPTLLKENTQLKEQVKLLTGKMNEILYQCHQRKQRIPLARLMRRIEDNATEALNKTK